MQILRKPIFLIALVVSFCFFFAYGFFIIKQDIKYAHTAHNGYQQSLDWFSLNLELLSKEIVRSIRNNNNVGLDQVRLYVSEKEQMSLMRNSPYSNKEWKKGHILESDKLEKIKLKNRGDNSFNWAFNKKSWRIKRKKTDSPDGARQKIYVTPQSYFFHSFLSYKIAKKIGVLSPNVRLVELFINDESYGVYLELDRLDETFLRHNSLMPINLYKGEQYNFEELIGLHDNLYNNHNLWKKLAYFNKFDKEDNNDLKNILVMAKKANNSNRDLVKFIDVLGINVWARYAAYQIISGNYHSSTRHNNRLAIDSWSGKVHPIVHDPDLSLDHNDILTSPNKLLSIFNRSSEFLDVKYELIWNLLTKDMIVESLTQSYCNEQFYKMIKPSLDRDIYSVIISYYENSRKDKYSSESQIKEIVNTCDKLLDRKSYLIEKFSGDPKASWFLNGENLNVIVDGVLPLSSLNVNFKNKKNGFLGFDKNYDGVINDKDLVFPVKDGVANIELNLFANRINTVNKLVDVDQIMDLKTAPTLFRFKVFDNLDIESIMSKNKYTGKPIFLGKGKEDYVLPNLFNAPVEIQKKERVTILSGNINFKSNKTFEEPVLIQPGTSITLDKNVSLIFENILEANGTIKSPISISREDPNKPWGVIALKGQKAGKSKLSYINIEGGSGAIIENIFYSGMLSIHDSYNIDLKNLSLKNNSIFDDMLHIVYGNDINLINLSLENALYDGIDIDISKNIKILNSKITGSNNDGIDLMDSSVEVENSIISGSGDKGISIGEKSKADLDQITLNNNNIGVAVKDGSMMKLSTSILKNNYVNIDSYNKNYQYGNIGGISRIYSTKFISKKNIFKSNNDSSIFLDESSYEINNFPPEMLAFMQNLYIKSIDKKFKFEQ